MVCNVCGQSEATIHLTEIINTQMIEIHLCETCAEQKGTDFKTHFDFNKLLASLADLGAAIKTEDAAQLVCKNCSMTYEEFGRTGRLGCSVCYESFDKALLPLIKRVQKALRHVGKVPARAGGDVRQVMELRELKEQMKKSIEVESFEKSAELRDRIKKLEEKMKTGRKKK